VFTDRDANQGPMETHPLARLETIVLVAIGGFVGANLRFLTSDVVPGLGGTLVVNVLGSFLLGVVLYEAIYTDVVSRQARWAVSTGFLSSFTTYSTFALQTTQAPSVALVVGNVVVTYALGFGAVLAGRQVARSFGPGTGEGVSA
jgi:CrcB protein